MYEPLLIKDSTILTLDSKNSILRGDVLVDSGRIKSIGNVTRPLSAKIIDGRGRILMPGFVQTHVHLCQTLFRGAADDLPLIDWLRNRIWPMEAAHTSESVYASARLGIAELIQGGTTSVLTMETVHHTESVFRAVQESGLRATVGKCMMDRGDGLPLALLESASESVAHSMELLRRWHGAADDRIRYAFAPRFALSCTSELLSQVARLSRENKVLVHTHASENRDEVKMVREETGKGNIEYLNDLGIAGPNVVMAHCVQVDETELDLLKQAGTNVAHCPSSNMKLGSGLAPIAEMIELGIPVSLGADGAACNNHLDMFSEMRLAALIQKARRGPSMLPALSVLRMATIGGARALGLGDQIGSIEPGKRADLILLNVEKIHSAPGIDQVSTIVYAAGSSDVETVIIDGQIVMYDRQLITMNEREIISEANSQWNSLNSSLNESSPSGSGI